MNNEQNIRLRFIDELPETIHGMARYDTRHDVFIIWINSSMTGKEKAKTLEHELYHIENGDLFSGEDVDTIEKRAHTALQ